MDQGWDGRTECQKRIRLGVASLLQVHVPITIHVLHECFVVYYKLRREIVNHLHAHS